MARLRWSARAARETLASAGRLAESVRTLSLVPQRLRARARGQRDRVRAQEAFERTRTTPLAELRQVTTKNLRLEELEAAGLSTVRDVLRSSPEELQRARGVGPQGAAAIRQAATDLLQRFEREAPARIDPDARTQDSEDLLRTLRMLLDFRAASRRAEAEAATLARDLPQRLDQARPSASWWLMALSRARTRENAKTALTELRQWVDGPTADTVNQAATKAVRAGQRAERLSARQLWTEFQRNAAAYTTLLTDLDRAGPEGAEGAARGFVPAEVAERVGEVELDTSLLKVHLRAYQAFGAKFALFRRRCMLGDEMGLGKTVQAIAVLCHAAARGGRHFLVVCPASVLINWIGEIGAHSELTAHQAHGSGRDAATADWLRHGGVAVTTFETLRRLPLPQRFSPDYVIVDEAHYVKNPQAARSQAVNAVAERASGVLMMTGTPLENRVEEFRDLISHLDPDLADEIVVSDRVLDAKEFRSRVAPVYLRRNQEDVLSELPELLELEDWVALGEDDQRAYSMAVGRRNFAGMRRATVINQAGEPSAKLERLVDLVRESADSGWKVVVFSFFLEVLAQVDEVIRTQLRDIPTFGLSGRVPAAERQRIVDEFGAVDGPAVLISQITAGGVGLNVQAASVVILTEPQLKPTIEAQAIARCHRMGQTRRVRVHRLLAKDTVDERLLEILEGKIELIEAYANVSDAKQLDPAAIDGTVLKRHLIDAERRRLGMATTPAPRRAAQVSSSQ